MRRTNPTEGPWIVGAPAHGRRGAAPGSRTPQPLLPRPPAAGLGPQKGLRGANCPRARPHRHPSLPARQPADGKEQGDTGPPGRSSVSGKTVGHSASASGPALPSAAAGLRAVLGVCTTQPPGPVGSWGAARGHRSLGTLHLPLTTPTSPGCSRVVWAASSHQPARSRPCAGLRAGSGSRENVPARCPHTQPYAPAGAASELTGFLFQVPAHCPLSCQCARPPRGPGR